MISLGLLGISSWDPCGTQSGAPRVFKAAPTTPAGATPPRHADQIVLVYVRLSQGGRVPSHQLTWNPTGGSRKIIFLSKGPARFHVNWRVGQNGALVGRELSRRDERIYPFPEDYVEAPGPRNGRRGRLIGGASMLVSGSVNLLLKEGTNRSYQEF